MGWQGKVLRVDLEAGSCISEPLHREWAEAYLGQRGLATRYLLASGAAGVDALDPGNPLIFATGPLTGTGASTGGRYSVVTKGALTGAVACSNSGGHFGAELKLAGWDLVIVSGQSPRPVYLLIVDDEARLLPAEEYWGRSIWEVEPALRERHRDPLLRVAGIGRGGELGVRYACVVNDLDRAAGRSGIGAVMGAKRLKAVAVRGTRGVRVADPQAFSAACRAKADELHASRSRMGMTKHGTLSMMDVTHGHGSLPTRNCTQVQFEAVGRVNARAVRVPDPDTGRPNLIANKACFACTIGCGRVARIADGHFSLAAGERYRRAGGGLEYESAYALGPMTGVSDLDALTYANFVCNEHTMDVISFGVTLAAAMELYGLGVIDTADTGGLTLEFGDAKTLVSAVELTARGEGFGKMLGLGASRLCAHYGRPELAMAVKGQEFPGYDPRAMQGMGLAYATSNRGACHLRADPYADDFERITPDGKAAIVKNSEDANVIVDSAGLCAFAGYTPEQVGELLSAATGQSWDAARLLAAGERTWNLERQFNLAAGLTAADDRLPHRLLREPAPSGAGEGKVCELGAMLPEYYALRGWTAEGVPTPETLNRLGVV